MPIRSECNIVIKQTISVCVLILCFVYFVVIIRNLGEKNMNCMQMRNIDDDN